MMRTFITLVLLAMLALAMPLRAENKTPAARGHVIVGYVFKENRVIAPGEIAARKLTHINYAFADIRAGRMVEGFAHDAENFAALQCLKAANPELKILISVGGWTWSGAFSDMALTAASRRTFIASAVAFIQKYKLDGLDIDWEYPGLPGLGNTFRPQDKQHFTALLAECRQAFNKLGNAQKKQYVLSAAIGASQACLDQLEMGQAAQLLDLVNVMTYDFAEAPVDPLSTHHACLYRNPAAPKSESVDGMARLFLQAGVPADKLVIGVPMYGRAWGDVVAKNNGLFQAGKEAHVQTSYRAIAANLLPSGGYVRYWDAIAHAPYLWSAMQRIFISYDDPQSVREKCRYILDRKLKGVMFWAYGDDGDALLDVMADMLH